MPIYSREITAATNSTQREEVEVEGDVITLVRIRFPPGPQGLLKVSIFYGIKQIFPHEEGTYFAGDDEIIQWDEYWELPESPCKLIIQADNDDDTYDHSVYIVLNVQKKSQTLAGQITKQIARMFGRLFGWL